MNSTIFKEVWAKSNEDKYFEMLFDLPPAYHFADGERLIAFLLGEPYDHNDEGQPRYHAFMYFKGHYYQSQRPMTVERFLFEMEELK